MQRKLPSFLVTLGIKDRLGIRKAISFHLNSNEPRNDTVYYFFSYPISKMQEEIIRFIRGLVGCDSLSGSKIETALIAAGAHDRMPDGNKPLAQLGQSASSLVIDLSGYRLGLSRGMNHILARSCPLQTSYTRRSYVQTKISCQWRRAPRKYSKTCWL